MKLNFFVFKCYFDDINVLIVTKNDKVFAFGNNNYGVLGFGFRSEIKELTINEDSSY
jgi:hypothetical protein